MYRHLFSFTLPVELCSGRLNCGATRLCNSKRRWGLAAGLIAAMQCYLMDLGFQAPDMSVWRRGDFVIRLNWGDPSTRTHVSDRLRMVMCKDRWHRIASQESASGVEQGIQENS